MSFHVKNKVDELVSIVCKDHVEIFNSTKQQRLNVLSHKHECPDETLISPFSKYEIE